MQISGPAHKVISLAIRLRVLVFSFLFALGIGDGQAQSSFPSSTTYVANQEGAKNCERFLKDHEAGNELPAGGQNYIMRNNMITHWEFECRFVTTTEYRVPSSNDGRETRLVGWLVNAVCGGSDDFYPDLLLISDGSGDLSMLSVNGTRPEDNGEGKLELPAPVIFHRCQ